MNTAACRAILAASDWHDTTTPPPEAVRELLLCQGSLTAKLEAGGVRIHVHIERETWQDDHWQRDVWLHAEQNGKQERWLYAETRVPRATLEHAAAPLLTLGAAPIGHWLFAQNPTRLDFHWRQDAASGLYARKSTLSLGNYPLHIRELFLIPLPPSGGVPPTTGENP